MKTALKAVLFILLASPGAQLALAEVTSAISPQEVLELQKSGARLILIDLRGGKDFELKHIPGAINIPFEEMHNGAGRLLPKNEDELLVLYCGSGCGGISYPLAAELAAKGYKARVIEGGFAAWKAKGLPVDGSARGTEPQPPRLISPAELKARLDKNEPLLILDVRPPQEFKAGHLPGARSMPLEALEFNFTQTQIVVYDRLPQRARKAARQLAEHGLKVSELEGGLMVWASRGYPLKPGLR